MIDAKLLATPDVHGASEVDVYGVWIPRKGDNARFTLEVAQNYFTDLTAQVYQKNYEDTGNGTAAGIGVNFRKATGRQTMEILGCMELIRFKLSLQRGSGLPGADVGLVLFRFLRPVWFEAVKG